MDYIIIGVIGVSVLFGFYRGFVSSLLNAGSGLVSFGLSFVLYPKLAAVIQGNEELVRTLMHYTDASSRIGNLSLATTNVVQMGQEKINEVLTSVSLPEPLNTMLSMDEGAAYLGECALVPQESPICQSGILFYNTLFDENAACHLAMGMGFPDTIEDHHHKTLEACRCRWVQAAGRSVPLRYSAIRRPARCAEGIAWSRFEV